MRKEIAHVRPLIAAHADDIGRLIERIEAGGEFEVVADSGEKGSFTIRVKKSDTNHEQKGGTNYAYQMERCQSERGDG